ncbi:MAG: coenzyme F390 synthetase [Gemmatales bacterium]|nr:MAG: coenzyme F390 synthetase [Gemmatales bacterium]
MVELPEERLDRDALEAYQLRRLEGLLRNILPANRFYAHKFAQAGFSHDRLPASVAEFKRIPFTTKKELVDDQRLHPPYGTALTFPLDDYARLHQTSGTSGQPLFWLDTKESWEWILACWEKIYRVVGIEKHDRLFFPFSFGPFLGFWSAFEAAWRQGFFCLSGGGLTSAARLRLLWQHRITVVLCTPTYARRLAEVARDEGIDLKQSAVRMLIVAGEPGGSIETIRQRIEKDWGARVFDHSGLTEVGPLSIECPDNPGGLHLLEPDYLVEVIEPTSATDVMPGQTGELVVTNLGRIASPVIRYRTGDLVRAEASPCPCGRSWRRLPGGILGRLDDMIHVRGNNLYPAALEAVLRRFEDIVEYRVEVDLTQAQAEVNIDLEIAESADSQEVANRVSVTIHDELLFRANVRVVPRGSLPRFEMKAQRFHLRR